MKTQSHTMRQGTPEWHAHRARHFNASDAAAMLGLSPYQSRDDLLRERALGLSPEIDAATQARFDRGHTMEEQARPIAEALLQEELFPVTLSGDLDGLPISASLDGLTLDGETAWEHKSLNAKLAQKLPLGDLPEHLWPQLEQILLLSGAGRILLTASNGDAASAVHFWYTSDPQRRQRLIDGWTQFAADLTVYRPTETKPDPIAEPIGQLPALLVEIEGRVVSTNLDTFKARAQSLIDGIKTDLATDADFSNAEATVKYCKDAEERLELVKRQALAQTASIDEVFRVMDGLREQLRTTRLNLDKQVKARKEALRAALVHEFSQRIAAHVASLNDTLGSHWLIVNCGTALGEAIKGRKSLVSCREALEAKALEIQSDYTAAAARLARNRSILKRNDRDWFPLFGDFREVGQKYPEDFDALAELRMSKALEAEAEAERVKAEREAAAAAADEAKRLAYTKREIGIPQADPAAPLFAEPSASTASEPPAHADEMTTPDFSAVTAFLKVRDFGDEHSYIRSILVEFVQFCSSRDNASSSQANEAA